MAVEVNGDGESFQSGNPNELFETPVSGYGRNQYVVSANGKRFLVNVPAPEREGARFKVALDPGQHRKGRCGGTPVHQFKPPREACQTR
jgi:hypothetical protein